MKKVYLDYAATSPVKPEVLEEMEPYFSINFANPASIHRAGFDARKAVDKARKQIADLLGASSPKEIVFTSGGTESDNLAIKGVAFADKKRHIVTCSTEHPAVLESCLFLKRMGREITVLPVDSEGHIDMEQLAGSIGPDTVLVSLMHANNEIGTVHPVEEIARLARERSVTLHLDGVQSFGKLPVNMQQMGNLFSISSHKIGGPKGVGILFVKRGTRVMPVMSGGGQELGLRSGTLNVPGIIGVAKAVELAVSGLNNHGEPGSLRSIEELKNHFLDRVRHEITGVRLNGPEERLPNNLNFSFRHAEGEALLIKLSSAGVYCSTGSACSSELHSESPVLKSIGLSGEDIKTAVRFSLGSENSRGDIDYAVDLLKKSVEELRMLSPDFD